MIWNGNNNPIAELKKAKDWRALRRYKISSLVDEALTGHKRILTLSPAEVIESDSIHIYKEFVSSPFIYRTSILVPDSLRKQLNIITRIELDGFLQENQPDAIFTGYEPERLEQPFVEYARENGYKEIDILMKRNFKLYIKGE
jgi:hypothetical protein